MTLVELLVAITIFLIVMTGIAAGATSGLALSRGNSNRIVAANIADEVIGDVRTMDYASITQGLQTLPSVTRGAVTYAVTRSADTVFLDAEGSCDSPSGAFNANRLSYLRVIVEVDWPESDGIDPVRSETIIEPPVAAYDPYAGHLAVKVADRDGAPQVGVTVRLAHADAATPATSRFEVTDDLGCVFFDNLKVAPGTTVGNYHLKLNEPGYVDRSSGLTDTSAQVPQPVVNVVSAQLRKVQFDYDRAATLDVTLAGRFGGSLPEETVPVWIANDNYNGGNGPRSFPSTGALAAQALHPFSAGFSLWAGTCGDADPGPTNRTRLATDPGVTTTGVVTMGTARFTVYRKVRGSDVAIPNATVVAEDACGTVLTAADRTDATGSVTIALPYGQWTLSAAGLTPKSPPRWPTVTLSPTDTAAVSTTKRVR